MEEQNIGYNPTKTRPTGVTILAALYIINGLIVLAAPLFMTAMLASFMGGESGTLATLTSICWVVFGILALIYFIIAYGLLKGQSWARLLAIIFAIISLINIPVGTIIGIIVLWYLFRPEVKAWFQ